MISGKQVAFVDDGSEIYPLSVSIDPATPERDRPAVKSPEFSLLRSSVTYFARQCHGDQPMETAPAPAMSSVRWFVLTALLVAYGVSLALPVIDNGPADPRTRNHMDPSPRGVIRGADAFRTSAALLLGIVRRAPDAASFDNPRGIFLWIALAWLANPLLLIAAGLLAGRWYRLAALAAALATGFALNARVAIFNPLVARDPHLQPGYFLWLAVCALLTLAALWWACRRDGASVRSVPRALAWTAVLAVLVSGTTGGIHHSVYGLVETHSRRGDMQATEPAGVAALRTLMRSANKADRRQALSTVLMRPNKEMYTAAPGEDVRTELAALLMEGANDEDASNRYLACLLINRWATPDEALPLLRRCVADPDRSVQQTAAASLLVISTPKAQGNPATAKTQEQNSDQRVAMDILTRGLEEGAKTERTLAMERLVGAGRHSPEVARLVVKHIAKLLDDPDPLIRSWAVNGLRQLGPIGHPEALKALGDSDARVVGDVLDVAMGMGPEARTHMAELSKLVHHADPRVRERAMHALNRIGPEAVPELMKLLSSSTPETRASAAKWLGYMDAVAAPALPRLREMTKDADPGVMHAATDAVERISAASAAKDAKR